MKKILVISIFLAACSSHSQQEVTVNNTNDSVNIPAPVNKFVNIDFASSKDLGCGMPLSTGVEDTAHYKGKNYGFCSTECKEDFLKDPEGHIAKK
jgi:YHS domain-containing protein